MVLPAFEVMTCLDGESDTLTTQPLRHLATNSSTLSNPGGGGGVLLSKRLLGMCRWMGSHFHNWINSNWVTFLVELLE